MPITVIPEVIESRHGRQETGKAMYKYKSLEWKSDIK